MKKYKPDAVGGRGVCAKSHDRRIPMASEPAVPADPFVDTLSRKYYVTTLLMVALIFGAWSLQHVISIKKNTLLQVEVAAGQQATFVLTIAMLVEAHQVTHDNSLLAPLGQAAGGAFVNYEALAPQIFPDLANGNGNEADRRRTYELDGQMRGFIDRAGDYVWRVNPDIQPLRRKGIVLQVDPLPPDIYLAVGQIIQAACPEAKGPCPALTGREHQNPYAVDAAVIAKLAQHIPPEWNSAVNDFVTVKQEEADTLASFSAALYLAMLGVLVYALEAVIRPAGAEIIGLRKHLEQRGSTDMLTGLYNRAMFFRLGAMLISGARRNNNKLTALAVDIDGIKKINDTHGHAAGDAAIRTVARALNELPLRGSDVTGRVDGAEFGVFLLLVDDTHAALVAEKLRAAVENLPFSVNNGSITLRVSIGVGEMQERHKTPDDVFRVAESALRNAKEKGRNCVSVFRDATGAPIAAPPPV